MRFTTLPVLAALASAGLAFQSPPVCDNGGPYTAECTGTSTAVPLDGTGSFDPDGTPISFFWFEECPFGFIDDPTSPTPNFIIDNSGVCSRTCGPFVLRVTSGGETVACQTTVTVEDTTPPVITCPPDVTEVWTTGPPTQTDPILTGHASATDCDPAPVILYSDTFDPGTAPGEPETIVTRTWTAEDFCGNQSSCVQTITLLSPSGSLGGSGDFMPGTCPNEVDSSTSSGVVTFVIYGTSSFNVTQIDTSSLMFMRADNMGTPVKRAHKRLRDVGRSLGTSACDCDSTQTDGRLDLVLTYSFPQLISELGLDQELSGTTVDFAVVGRDLDGRWFTMRDCATIQ